MDTAELIRLIGTGSPSLILSIGCYMLWGKIKEKEQELAEERKRHDDFIQKLLEAHLKEEKEA